MVQFVLDAGQRTIRTKERDCRLLFTVDANGQQCIQLMTEATPAEMPVISIPLEEFRELMRANRLRFRQRISEEERQRRMNESLQKYRNSPKYEALRANRRRSPPHELTEDERSAIRSSNDLPRTLARRYRISLREVAEIRQQEDAIV